MTNLACVVDEFDETAFIFLCIFQLKPDLGLAQRHYGNEVKRLADMEDKLG